MSVVNFVKHPDTGNFITESQNKEGWGKVRVDAKTKSINNGILNISNRSVFISGKIENLKALLDQYPSKVMPGKIIRLTSEQPFYQGQKPVMKGNTEEVALNQNGNPYYQQYEFTEDLSKTDKFIEQSSHILVEDEHLNNSFGTIR